MSELTKANCGLSEDTINAIRQVFRQHANIEQAILFERVGKTFYSFVIPGSRFPLSRE